MLILSIVGGVWVLCALGVIALCAMSARGDRANELTVTSVPRVRTRRAWRSRRRREPSAATCNRAVVR